MKKYHSGIRPTAPTSNYVENCRDTPCNPKPQVKKQTARPAPAAHPSNLSELDKFHKTYLGMEPTDAINNGKGTPTTTDPARTCRDPISSPFAIPTKIYNHIGPQPHWKNGLPRPIDLYRQEFGKPDTSHSFTQEACSETTLHLVLKSGFLSATDTLAVHATHPLIAHLDKSRERLANYDFTWIRNYNKNWASQKNISHRKSMAMFACLLHSHSLCDIWETTTQQHTDESAEP